MEKQNVPELRFKQDDGTEFPAWQSLKIGNMLKLCHGKDYKELEKGNIPVLGTGGVIAYVNQYLCDWPCALIGRKGTIDAPQYMDTPFWTVDTLFYSKPAEGQDPLFQYYLFQLIPWMKYNEASGVPSLSASTVENISVKAPCSTEQKKIADLLLTLDHRIDLAVKKYKSLQTIKQGMLQKIFSQELRFKDDEGKEYPAWEERKLSDITVKIGSGKTPLGGSNAYQESGIPLIRSQNVENAKLSLSDVAYISEEVNAGMKNSIVRKDDILLNITGASIGRCCIYDSAAIANVNQHVCIIRLKEGNTAFILQQMLSRYFQAQIDRVQAGGSKQGLNFKQIGSFEVGYPCLPEQQKIAAYFTALDRAIAAAQQKAAALRTIKRGLLQKMFV